MNKIRIEHKRKTVIDSFGKGMSKMQQDSSQYEFEGGVSFEIGKSASLESADQSDDTDSIWIDTIDVPASALTDNSMFEMKKPFGYAVKFFKQFATKRMSENLRNPKKINF